jgi:hypothetical protein
MSSVTLSTPDPQAARHRAAPDPEPEDPVWPGVFKGKTYFYFQKIISLFEKP